MKKKLIDLNKTAKKIGNTIASGAGKVVTAASTPVGDAKPSGDTKKITPPKTVAARDYTAGRGYAGAVDWDGKNAVIGGVAVAPEYMQDGKAYVTQEAADAAIREMEQRNGILGAEGIRREYNSRYGNTLDSAVDAMVNRAPFEYDPDSDPAYNAYKRKYTEEGENAYRRILNDNNTSVTGASGAVIAEATAARESYLRQLTDMLPTLQANAYDRYRGESERLQDNADLLNEIAGDYYDRLYNGDRDRIANLNAAGKAEREEQQRWIDNAAADFDRSQTLLENQRQAVRDSYDNALSEQALQRGEAELEYYPQQLRENLRESQLANDRTAVENAVTGAIERGFFTRADEAALPWLARYRSGYGSYSVSPWEAQARYEYDIEHAKKLADFHASWGM